MGSNWFAKTSIAKLFVIYRNMNYYLNQHQCFSERVKSLPPTGFVWKTNMAAVTSCENALLRSHSYVMNGWRNLVFSYLTYIWMIPFLFNTVWVILKIFIHICFWSFNSVEQTKIKPFQRNSWPCYTDLLKENANWLKQTCILFSLCHYYSKWRRLEN